MEACVLTEAFSLADWDNVSLSNETLLDTVSRFVFAALLKHTGLLGQGCGEGRYCSAIASSVHIHTVMLYTFIFISHQVPTIKVSR